MKQILVITVLAVHVWKLERVSARHLLLACSLPPQRRPSLFPRRWRGCQKTFAVPSLTKLAELNRHEITAICSVTKAAISKHAFYVFNKSIFFLQSIESRLKINFHIRFLKSCWWNQKKNPFAFPNGILILILQELFKNSAVVCFTNPQDISSADKYQLFLPVNYK